MKQSFRSLTILLTIILLLPVLFLTGYELLQMNNNEKAIENIYTKQLDAITFSINLYSDDYFDRWKSKISIQASSDKACNYESIKQFLSINTQIRSIIFSDGKNIEDLKICSSDPSANNDFLKKKIIKLLNDSVLKINKLKSNFRSGFQKIEQLGSGIKDNYKYIIFLIELGNDFKYCILEIDQEKFIKEILGQKIQMAAKNDLIIGVGDSISKKLVYSVGEVNSLSDFQVHSPMWYFPQYQVGVKLKDQSIKMLARQRTKLNLMLLLFADLIFIIGAFVVFRNIRKELYLTQIKSEFISNVSHEIRTPLALISMYAETLEMDRIKTEEKKKEYYQIIYNEIQRLSGMVNRILNFSKMESGKRMYTFIENNLNELVLEIMQTYNFHLKNKGFEHSVNLSEKNLVAKFDADAIADAVINLIDNAIKYSTDKKQIDITTGFKKGCIYIEITDKGIGIAKEEQKMIFDKFYRASTGNIAHVARGTGLGLTIVKNIIDAHKGKIELESNLGEGSRFRIILPENILNHV
jgi:two-component system, OmpR family, phosphate regulon sensor histidine kinase PhoR